MSQPRERIVAISTLGLAQTSATGNGPEARFLPKFVSSPSPIVAVPNMPVCPRFCLGLVDQDALNVVAGYDGIDGSSQSRFFRAIETAASRVCSQPWPPFYAQHHDGRDQQGQ